MKIIEELDLKAAQIAAQFADLRETLLDNPVFFQEFRMHARCYECAQISVHLKNSQRQKAPDICRKFGLSSVQRTVGDCHLPYLYWEGKTKIGARVTIFNAEEIPADELIDLSKFQGGGA